jgi:hypothetical protein
LADRYVIRGKHGVLDYSVCPQESDRAEALLHYFDDKFPKVFESLRLELPPAIDIFLINEAGAACSNENRYVKYGIKNQREDLGCLIHEIVHLAQNYDYDTYNNNRFIAEGMADYLRVRLSNDGWDNPEDSFPCLHHPLQRNCSKCGARFLIWLEAKLEVKDFIVRVNNCLKKNLSFSEFLFSLYEDNRNE